MCILIIREEVKEVVKQAIKSTINTSVSSSINEDVVSDIEDDNVTSQQHSLGYRMRSLPFTDWLCLLKLIFENLIKVVKLVFLVFCKLLR